MLRDIFVIVNSEGVRQAVIGACHRLVVVPDLTPAEPVEEGIDVGLPVVHRLELADELRGRLFVRRQRGNDAHNAAGFYRRLCAKGKEATPSLPSPLEGKGGVGGGRVSAPRYKLASPSSVTAGKTSSYTVHGG